MVERQWLLASIRDNPRRVRFEELQALLLALGFQERHPGMGRSLHAFVHPDLPEVLIISRTERPHVALVYVRQALKAIEALEGR